MLVDFKELSNATSDKPLEVIVSDKTKVTGFGVKSLYINGIEDLRQGNKVKVWLYSTKEDNQKIADKVVVYSLFNFHLDY